jgi:dephospho-CoA kinase
VNSKRHCLIVGISGNIASGKSVVAEILRDRGADLINADILGHKLLEKEAVKNEIINLLGDDVLDNDCELDREKISKILFNNPELLSDYNEIIHPDLLNLIRDKISRLKQNKKGLIVLDAALIPEWGFQNELDLLIVITSPLEDRIERVMKRYDISKDEAISRIESQISQEERLKYADIVIGNDSTILSLEKKAYNLYDSLMERIDVL